MLELVDLFEFEVIVAPKLGVASSHGVGGFQQVVAEIAVARLDKFGVLGLEIAGLVLCPNQAGVFGNGCLRVKAVDIAGLGNDTGGVDLAMPGTEVSVLGMIWNCCSMVLSNTLICFSRARMVAMETAIAWFTELFTVTGKR